jgi:hypothetical protein
MILAKLPRKSRHPGMLDCANQYFSPGKLGPNLLRDFIQGQQLLAIHIARVIATDLYRCIFNHSLAGSL